MLIFLKSSVLAVEVALNLTIVQEANELTTVLTRSFVNPLFSYNWAACCYAALKIVMYRGLVRVVRLLTGSRHHTGQSLGLGNCAERTTLCMLRLIVCDLFIGLLD